MQKRYCSVFITYKDGTKKDCGWADREISTENGRVVIHRPGTGVTTIPPSDAEVYIES